MYTALKRKHTHMEHLIANDADLDLQTIEPGPLIDYHVPSKYTINILNTIGGEDTSETGFT